MSGAKLLWQRAKESMSDVCRVRNYIRFLILLIPSSSDCKKTFSRIFGNFNTHNFLWIFYILTQSKNPRKKKSYKFQRQSLLAALHKKICACPQRNFLVLVFGHRWKEGLMKSKIVKVKSFYNYLTHYLPAITEFFWDTLMYLYK